jgi:SHS2 domain-containing protein
MQDIDSNQVAGYREREHTADWELEVWAPDLPRLLEQAARGMYRLAGLRS